MVEVAAGAEPKANPGKGQAEPDAIVHQEEVVAGAEPRANPGKGRAENSTPLRTKKG